MDQLPSQHYKKLTFDKKTLTIGGLGLAIVILALSAGFFFVQYQNAQKKIGENPELAAALNIEKERDKLIKKVSELVELPGNETPTIATVEDKSKVTKQLFYAKAENGDNFPTIRVGFT